MHEVVRAVERNGLQVDIVYAMHANQIAWKDVVAKVCVATRQSACARGLRDGTPGRQATCRRRPVPGRSTTGRAAQCTLATAVSLLRW
jgi:hypothetical protein